MNKLSFEFSALSLNHVCLSESLLLDRSQSQLPFLTTRYFYVFISLVWQIQEEFCYLPRTAVAKFIELCDTCSVRLTRLRAGKQAEQCRRGGTKRARSDSEVIPAVPVVGDHENECKRTRREECLFSTVQHPLLSSSLLLEGKELPEELKEVMAGLGWEELLSLYNESSTDSFQPSASSENRAS